jgi:hypothetical protein
VRDVLLFDRAITDDELAGVYSPSSSFRRTRRPRSRTSRPRRARAIGRSDPIFFDVTDDKSALRRVIIAAKFADGTYEVVHDGDVFADGYKNAVDPRGHRWGLALPHPAQRGLAFRPHHRTLRVRHLRQRARLMPPSYSWTLVPDPTFRSSRRPQQAQTSPPRSIDTAARASRASSGRGSFGPFRRDLKNDFAATLVSSSSSPASARFSARRPTARRLPGEVQWRTNFGSKLHLLRHSNNNDLNNVARDRLRRRTP